MSSLFHLSPRAESLCKVLHTFIEQECIPAEKLYHDDLVTDPSSPNRWTRIPPIIETLKTRAKKLGLWNLFLHKAYKEGPGFTNLEYAVMCEMIGKSLVAAEATNTSAPDTGNMEILAKYATEEQKSKWLVPLLEGTTRSAFAMTEPGVASSDATNIQLEIKKDGKEYLLNGEKWWISGAGDPRCSLYFVVGKIYPQTTSDPYLQQSIILVPSSTKGISIVRPMTVFGYDDAPHGHMHLVFKNVRVPLENILLGEGRGFEIMQGRLGPGRIHHCMRSIGIAERALELHILRLLDPSRKAFGKEMLGMHDLASHAVCQSRLEIDQARLLVLDAAAAIDKGILKNVLSSITIPYLFFIFINNHFY